MLATRFQTLAGDARHIVGVAPAPHTRRDAWLAPAAIRARNAGSMSEFGDTVDRNDIDRFAAQSAAWWDPEGSFRPLHRINPARLDFIRRQLLASFRRDAKGLRPFEGLRLIDIGCGTTDVGMFVEGALVYACVLPVGGFQVSNDLAVGLRTPFAAAEEIKIRHGYALPELLEDDRTIDVFNLARRLGRGESRRPG